MVGRLRLALLIVAAGVTLYLAFPALQTLSYAPTDPCQSVGFKTPKPGCGRSPEMVAGEQRDAWLDFARVEIIVVVVTAALWVLVPVLVARERSS